MHVIVTGGAGYIGSHVCKALHFNGFVPVVCDNLTTGHAYAVKWGKLIEKSLERKSLEELFRAYKPVAVMHFAADAIVSESMQDPGKYYANNVGSTLSLLEAMRTCSVDRLIFSSSCATYGHPQSLPLTEEHPQVPISPYGRTKWIAEQMMDDFEGAFGLRSVRLRYFNAAGSDQDLEIGEDHVPETHLIPSILEAVIGKRPQLMVYGSDFDTVDGSAVRDYAHVEDIAEAHVLALRYLLEGGRTVALNIGAGKAYSVFEVIRAVEKVVNLPVPMHVCERRLGDPAKLIASIKKADEILGWKPRRSSLDTMVSSAWNWQKKGL